MRKRTLQFVQETLTYAQRRIFSILSENFRYIVTSIPDLYFNSLGPIADISVMEFP